jgi:hypothetical protein
MNTETLSALKQVNLQIQQLQDVLHDPALKLTEVGPVEDVLLNLEGIQDTLIHQTLQNMIDQLNQSNGAMQVVLAKMQATSDRLAKLAATIKKVSDLVGALAQVTQKALSAGLLG